MPRGARPPRRTTSIGRCPRSRRSSRASRPTPTCSICARTCWRRKASIPGRRLTMALRSARKAVALQPGLAPAHAVLAKLYLQAGRHREAIEQCARWRSTRTIRPACTRLIQALRKSGETAEIPALLQRLAAVREQAAKQERGERSLPAVIGDHEAPRGAAPLGSLGAWQVRPSFAQSRDHTASRCRVARCRGVRSTRWSTWPRAGLGSRSPMARRDQEMHPRDDPVRLRSSTTTTTAGWTCSSSVAPARRRSAGRHQSALQEQPRRHLHRRHRTGRPRRRRGGRRRLRRWYNNDGFEDLFCTAFGQNRLYRNNGDGTFADVTKAAGLRA